MKMAELAVATGAYLAVPALGVTAFALLVRRMRVLGTSSPPITAYFVIFAIAGGWLLVVLTALFLRWSGMASIGIFF